MAAQILWEDPPPPMSESPGRRKGSRILPVEVVDEIRANPGRWARLPECSPGMLTWAKANFPDLEVTTRRALGHPGRVIVYVRARADEIARGDS